MIWFVITYCVLFSVVCFFYTTHIYSKKLDELTRGVDGMVDDVFEHIKLEYEEKFAEYKLYQTQHLKEVTQDVQKENSKKLNQLNKELNTKLDNLANNISKRPIV